MSIRNSKLKYFVVSTVLIVAAILIVLVIRNVKEERIILQSPPNLKAELRSDKWVQVNGPYGGWITDLEKVDNNLFASTSFTNLGGNGVYRISNKGLKWNSLGGTNKKIPDLAVDPSDANNIAFVTEDGLFLTKDGGRQWQQIKLEASSFSTVSMDPSNSKLIYLGAIFEDKGVIFISKDDGRTWTKSSFLPKTNWSIKSVWKGISNKTVNIIAPHPLYQNSLLVGTNSALFKTDNQGRSWKPVDKTFHRRDIKGIEINPKNPNEVYVRVGVYEDLTSFKIYNIEDREQAEKLEKAKGAGVYKSTDFGETWRQLDAYYADPSEGGVFVDEYNPNNVYAIFARKILSTKNGGETWKEFFWTHNEPLMSNVGLERLVIGGESSELFLAGRQGLWHSEDTGGHWHERNVGFIGSEVVDIVKANDGTLYAGTYTLGMFKSTDKGQNWTFASYGLENPYVMLAAVHPKDSKKVFVTTNGGVYASYDGAQTWQLVAEDFFFDKKGVLSDVAHFHGIAFDPKNPHRIYVGGGGDQYSPQGAGMSISEDGGQTWRRANKGFATNVHVSKIFVDKKNPSIVYATTQGPTNFQEKMGSGHGVFKSTNNGKSWRKIKKGLGTAETNTFAIDPSDSNTLYLGTDDDGIYKSVNGGESWQRLNIGGLPEHYGVGDIVVDPKDTNTIYAATVDYFRLFLSRGVLGDHGVYVSKDGGKNWQSFNDGLTHSGAFALELDDEKGILYVGTRGGGIYWRAVR